MAWTFGEVDAFAPNACDYGFFSDRAWFEITMRALELGAIDFVTKPKIVDSKVVCLNMHMSLPTKFVRLPEKRRFEPAQQTQVMQVPLPGITHR